jgi:predicted secreted protein
MRVISAFKQRAQVLLAVMAADMYFFLHRVNNSAQINESNGGPKITQQL